MKRDTHALDVDTGLADELDTRACPDCCGTSTRRHVSKERCQGEARSDERDVVRDRAAHTHHVRRWSVKLANDAF